MLDVAIVGAGDLGGSIAHVLARRDCARTVRIVEMNGQIAAGKALDIMQASPIEGFATRVSGSTDLGTIGAASLVVLADRAGGGEWQGDEGWLLLKQISQLARASVVVCAGASHRELVERGVRELGFSGDRLFGSAPEALASAVRSLVALETNGSASDVMLTILGVPPAQTVIPWEDASISGFAATRVLDELARRRVNLKLAPLWPPGPYALAHAAVETIAGVAGQSRRALSCFVAPDDSAGRRMRAAALPVRLDAGGVVRVEVPPLSVSARVALDNAMLI